jgi:hypothetical protein
MAREEVDDIVLASIKPPSVWDFYVSREQAEAKREEANAYNVRLEAHGAPHRVYSVMTYSEYKATERAFYLADPPEEITREKFFEMLEVLPPKRWVNTGSFESFLMSEHWSGNYTHQYARRGNRYYSKMVDASDKSTWMQPEGAPCGS